MARMAIILRQKFYIGLIQMRCSDIVYQGIHPPLINRALFERVQRIMDGHVSARIIKHDFLFRKLIKCENCNYSMIGERQKGHIYYRCHTKSCSTGAIREEAVEIRIRDLFASATLTDEEAQILYKQAKNLAKNCNDELTERRRSVELTKAQISQRLSHPPQQAFPISRASIWRLPTTISNAVSTSGNGPGQPGGAQPMILPFTNRRNFDHVRPERVASRIATMLHSKA